MKFFRPLNTQFLSIDLHSIRRDRTSDISFHHRDLFISQFILEIFPSRVWNIQRWSLSRATLVSPVTLARVESEIIAALCNDNSTLDKSIGLPDTTGCTHMYRDFPRRRWSDHMDRVQSFPTHVPRIFELIVTESRLISLTSFESHDSMHSIPLDLHSTWMDR